MQSHSAGRGGWEAPSGEQTPTAAAALAAMAVPYRLRLAGLLLALTCVPSYLLWARSAKLSPIELQV